MNLKKTEQIKKLEETLRKAKQKQKDDLKDINNIAMNLILKKMYEDPSTNKNFERFLIDNRIEKVYELISNTYELATEKKEINSPENQNN